MAIVTFEGTNYQLKTNESVLDGLQRQGAELQSSCRAGVCQACLLRADAGSPPAESQAGLKETLRFQDYFLACLCVPESDMSVSRPGEEAIKRIRARVAAKERLNSDILRLRLECCESFEYRAGQFLHLHRADGLVRSYSLASGSRASGRHTVELHVRRLPGGQMTEWIHESLSHGDEIDVSGPSGSCFYAEGRADQPILLIGTGSGLAPLWGIIHDALSQNHTGSIELYHGSWTAEGLYLVGELRKLDEVHPNFTYHACVDTFRGEALPGYRQGRVDQLAFADHPKLSGWRVFLCGHPDLVAAGRKQAFLRGASMKDIFADPFVLSKQADS